MSKKACQVAFRKWSENPKINEFHGKKRVLVGDESCRRSTLAQACGLATDSSETALSKQKRADGRIHRLFSVSNLKF